MSETSVSLITLVAALLGAFFISTEAFKKILVIGVTRLKLAGFLATFCLLFVGSLYALNYILMPFISHQMSFSRIPSSNRAYKWHAPPTISFDRGGPATLPDDATAHGSTTPPATNSAQNPATHR